MGLDPARALGDRPIVQTTPCNHSAAKVFWRLLRSFRSVASIGVSGPASKLNSEGLLHLQERSDQLQREE